MAFLEKFAFAPAMVSYLCSELQTVAFMACLRMKINQNFSKHVLHAWFVCHCDGLHALGAHNRDKPFHASAASGRSLPLTLEQAQKHLCNFLNFTLCQNPPINTSHWARKRHGGVLNKPNLDFCNQWNGRLVVLTKMEKEWLLTICPADFVFRRGNVVDIQVYTPSRCTA